VSFSTTDPHHRRGARPADAQPVHGLLADTIDDVLGDFDRAVTLGLQQQHQAVHRRPDPDRGGDRVGRVEHANLGTLGDPLHDQPEGLDTYKVLRDGIGRNGVVHRATEQDLVGLGMLAAVGDVGAGHGHHRLGRVEDFLTETLEHDPNRPPAHRQGSVIERSNRARRSDQEFSMRSAFVATLAAVLAVPVLAAGPSTQAPPEGIDGEMSLTRADESSYASKSDTGGVNVWTHISAWEPTCASSGDNHDNRCEKVLLHVEDAGFATITMSANYEGMDYDLVIFKSAQSGSAYYKVAQSQNEIFVESEGPIPLPGDETVTFKAEADSWYLAVVFYRAAGGGYTLTGQIVDEPAEGA
jgi:hypothetical protein